MTTVKSSEFLAKNEKLALSLINEFQFVRPCQLRKYLKNINNDNFAKIIDFLKENQYVKEVDLFDTKYIVPYEYSFTEKRFKNIKEQVEETSKALDLFIHIANKNNVVEYRLCYKSPVKIVFICLMSDKKYRIYEILYVNKGNETTTNILADRLLYLKNEETDSYSPVDFVIVEEESQIHKLNLKNVGGYFTVDEKGNVSNINLDGLGVWLYV